MEVNNVPFAEYNHGEELSASAGAPDSAGPDSAEWNTKTAYFPEKNKPAEIVGPEWNHPCDQGSFKCNCKIEKLTDEDIRKLPIEKGGHKIEQSCSGKCKKIAGKTCSGNTDCSSNICENKKCK